jgi:cell division protein FtsB
MGIRIKLTRARLQRGVATVAGVRGWLRLAAHTAYSGRRRLATGAIVLLAACISYHVVFGSNGMLVYEQKRSEFKQLQQEIEGLQKENGRYTRHIQALKSSPDAIEREAREQLRYAKPGEVVYVLPGEAQTSPPSTSTARK